MEDLAAAIRGGRVPFPYKRQFLPPAAEYMRRLAAAADHVAVETRYPGASDCRAAIAELSGGAGAGRQRDLVPWGFVDGPRGACLVSFVVDHPGSGSRVSAYDDIDVLPDLFTEEARMQARVLNNPSPIEVWRREPEKVIAAGLKSGLCTKSDLQKVAGNSDVVGAAKAAAHCLREGVYGAAREATQFKISLGAAVYRYFAGLLGEKPEDLRVLDPSAGWGDRALAAAAAGIGEYVGADPNPRLREGHAAVAAAVEAEAERAAAAHRANCVDPCPHGFDAPALARPATRLRWERVDGSDPEHGAPVYSFSLGPEAAVEPVGPTRIRVIPKPFEDISEQELAGGNLPEGSPNSCSGTSFDLVFTSPPFFDFETYNEEDPHQSLARSAPGAQGDPSYTKWLGWFVAFCAKGYALLRPGGFLALYFVDHRPRSAGASPRGRDPERPSDAVRRAIAAAGGRFVGVAAARRGTKRPIPIWVFMKPRGSEERATVGGAATVSADKLPPLLIKEYPVSAGAPTAAAGASPSVYVVRDDILEGGTKMRIMIPFMKTRAETQAFIYVSPPTGFAQVALALSARATGKRAIVFVRDGPLTSATRAARDAGARIVRPRGKKRLRDLREAAAEFAARENAAARATEVMPFGLQSEELIAGLAAGIREAFRAMDADSDISPAGQDSTDVGDPAAFEPARVWLAVGSGVILRAVHRVWPRAKYMCVQVGKEIYPDILEDAASGLPPIDHEVLVAPEHFAEPARALGPRGDPALAPPYPSVASYDAKVWRFVAERARADPGSFGKDARGSPTDLVWNVAADA